MDLWIRSQDRESIFKVKSVFYSTDGENEHLIRTIVIDNVHNGIVKIGQYKTKERVLEVLDEIEERITLLNTLNTVTDVNSLISFKNAIGEDKAKGLTVPYQMPEE